ncbi:hypothetical protein MRB53_027922 [Persea americana]|uniref:Uncharacterized protein n=1 Tax=Persea americana TaxID=3435 RepID=A0ACC2KEQ4_PERAE|nr:hypothetical protein MRB53_027922 [Persea americana]
MLQSGGPIPWFGGTRTHVKCQIGLIHFWLAKLDYLGPVSISACVSTQYTPGSVQRALSSAGIALNITHTGVEDISDKKLLVNMLLWAVDNPPPANYLMISGDHYFFNALCELSERGYNILRAQPRNVSGPVLDDANVWLWTSLSVGGAPFQSADSSLPLDAANAEMSKDVSSDPLHGKLLVEFVPESFQLGNQKGSDNSVLDNDFKGKWQWRSSTQYNMPRTSSTEFWLPPAETQGDSSDESYDASSQKGMSAIPQQNEVPTSKSLSINHKGALNPTVPGQALPFSIQHH